jgi:hypothetical protein
MNINLSISAAPGITSNKLVVAIYDSTAPATVAASRVLNAPHTAPVNVSFTSLRSGVYLVKVYESVDGTPSGVLRHSFVYNTTFGGAKVREDEVLIVGQTEGLVAGTTTYDNLNFTDWDYTVERRGVGSLIDFAKSSSNADYITKSTGGFTLIKPDDVFGEEEIFIVRFLPQIIKAENQTNQTSGVLWGGAKDVTTNTDLQAADMGKYCLLQGDAAVLNVTLPSGNSVVDGTMIAFLSEGGSHVVANIIPKGTDQIKWLGDTWAANDPFSIHQGEEVWMMYHGNSWRVIQADGGWRQVGEFVYSYNRNQINSIPANGAIYNRAYYPRLWRYVKKYLDPTLLVDASIWEFADWRVNFHPNVCKYSNGNGTTTFQTPLLIKSVDQNGNIRSGGYLRAVSGDTSEEKAGVQKKDAVGNFQLRTYLPTGDSYLSHPYPPTAFGKGLKINYPYNLEIDVLVTGLDPTTKTANGETRPFSSNAYLSIKF